MARRDADRVAFSETGVVSLVLNADPYIRELKGTYQAKAQLDQADSQNFMKSMAQMDGMAKKSLETLDNNLNKSAKADKKRRDEIIKGFDADKVTKPVMVEGMELSPGASDAFNAELKAMEGNMNRFHRRMMDMGYDVGQGMTIEEDIGATLGGDAPQRKAAAAAIADMLTDEKELQRTLKGQNKIREEAIVDLNNQRESLLGQARELKKIAKNEKLSKEERDKLISQAKTLEGQAGMRTRYIKDELAQIKENNRELDQSNLRYEDALRTKEKAKNVDMALTANDKKRQDQEKEFFRKQKREMKEIIDVKQKEIQLQKERSRNAQAYIQQVDAMADSFKTTLVGAIGLSTAAFAGMKMQLDKVVGVFQDFEEELMNAQSIFQTSQETLYSLSDEIVTFGNQYGVSFDNASQGLYTLASAGLDANDSLMVLNNTLKLAMAVNGDHETVAKLTTQTIFGFGLEMEDSAELTDKFAHSINKSLIEYQDLASAVKFAMPFFVSTGQNIDQLLGSLEILTNRALEAGIAGRGLRQALAEFAQHAEDNEAAFRKMGVEIIDAEGNFKMLTEIAKDFQTAMGPAASDVDLMTTLLEDLNVRGATAFVHLVQNADEFGAAVDNLENATGAATAMADVQQQSLARTIQVIKNSFESIFVLSDEIGSQQGHLNEFALELHRTAEAFENLFTKVEDGKTVLTPLGQQVKDLAVTALQQFRVVMQDVINAFQDMTENGTDFTGLLNMMTVPLRMAVKLLGFFGGTGVEAILILKTLNGLMPISAMLTMQLARMTEMHTMKLQQDVDMTKMRLNLQQQVNEEIITEENALEQLEYAQNKAKDGRKSAIRQMQIQMGLQVAMNAIQFANIYLMRQYAKDSPKTAAMIGVLSGSLMGLAMALSAVNAGMKLGPWGFIGYMVAGAVIMAGMNAAMTKMMQAPSEIEGPSYDSVSDPAANLPTYDMGGRIMYDTGGPRGGGLGSRHKMVMVEPGETIIPKSQNMLGVGASGITLNMGDVMVQDGEDFAERVAAALPEALRRQNDIGGI